MNENGLSASVCVCAERDRDRENKGVRVLLPERVRALADNEGGTLLSQVLHLFVVPSGPLLPPDPGGCLSRRAGERLLGAALKERPGSPLQRRPPEREMRAVTHLWSSPGALRGSHMGTGHPENCHFSVWKGAA